MALTLTKLAAETQLGLALELAARPATVAALEAGRIDLRKARVILEAVGPLPRSTPPRWRRRCCPDAAGQTTGELRRRSPRAVLALDPDAVRRRREEAEKRARVECWTDPDGTATLTGRSLPPAEVLAADKRLCQVARYWKKRSGPRGSRPTPWCRGRSMALDLLRAKAYLALLLGQPLDVPPADLLPPAQAPAPARPGRRATRAAAQPPARARHGGAGPSGSPDPAAPRAPARSVTPRRPPWPERGAAGRAAPPRPGGRAAADGRADQPHHPAFHLPRRQRPARRGRRVRAAARRHRPADRLRPRRAPGHPLAGHPDRPRRPRPRRRHRRGNPASPGTSAGAGSGGGWTVQVTAEPIAAGHCDHRNQEPGHDPAPGCSGWSGPAPAPAPAPAAAAPRPLRSGPHAGLRRRRHHLRMRHGPALPALPPAQASPGWALRQPSPRDDLDHPAGRRYTTYPASTPPDRARRRDQPAPRNLDLSSRPAGRHGRTRARGHLRPGR